MLTLDKVQSYAPDESTLNRGEQLANSGKWVILEGNENLVWGRCKGSGSSTYKTAVHFAAPTFTCSCPVRKKPCKHLMGLMLLYTRQSDAFRITYDQPDWVTNWLSKKAPKPKKTNTPDELAKAEKRKQNQQERINRMIKGAEDLEIWLMDLIREGMAQVETQDYRFWQDVSARMVDLQLGSIGPRLRELQFLPTTKKDWASHMLKELASIYLVVSGFKNWEKLPEPLQTQLIRTAGVKDQKKDVLAQAGIKDLWGVIGSFEGVNIDNIAFRRTWLLGRNSKKYALLLEYSFGGRGYDVQWKTGHIYETELMYYPAAYPLRAVTTTPDPTGENIRLLKGNQNINDFFKTYAEAIAQHPWLMDFPCCLEKVTPVKTDDEFLVVDENRNAVPLLVRPDMEWTILALSGGHPISVFGEWTGEGLVPLSAVVEERFVELQ